MQYKNNDIVEEMHYRFGEWIEQSGEQSPFLLIDILAGLLRKERELNDYYKIRLRNEVQRTN